MKVCAKQEKEEGKEKNTKFRSWVKTRKDAELVRREQKKERKKGGQWNEKRESKKISKRKGRNRAISRETDRSEKLGKNRKVKEKHLSK